MSVMKLNNPFVIRGYAGPEYFCDRDAETKKLLSALRNERDVTLIAPRRYGKTGLIHHVLGKLPRDTTGIYLDIFSQTDLKSFTKALASSVIGSLDSKVETALTNVGRFFKSCRPTVTPQAEGWPKFSFDVVDANAEATLAEIFAYLKSKDRRVVIAIDEFQQISEFPERGVEALLRSQIQLLPNVRFIFAGSRKHLMEEMFASPQRPFFQSTQILSLREIDSAAYETFARRFFEERGLPFESSPFQRIYRRFEGVTWYVQATLSRIWEMGEGLTNERIVDEAVRTLIEDNQLVYSDLLRTQNEGSRMLLKAVAREGKVAAVSAGAFVAKYGLKAASSAAFALEDLRKKELVYETAEGWIVYDRLFGEYLKSIA